MSCGAWFGNRCVAKWMHGFWQQNGCCQNPCRNASISRVFITNSGVETPRRTKWLHCQAKCGIDRSGVRTKSPSPNRERGARRALQARPRRGDPSALCVVDYGLKTEARIHFATHLFQEFPVQIKVFKPLKVRNGSIAKPNVRQIY